MAAAAATTARALPPVELSDVAAGNGGFVMNGIDPGDYSGFTVSGAGDVNGDGLADLIVGAYHAHPGGNLVAGESYVVFGKAGTTAVNLADVVAGNGGFVINGINPGDLSGKSVSGAGDVNGDGLDDLIVGAKGAEPGGDLSAGASYVIFGKADGTAVNLSDIVAGNGGFGMRGIDPFDFSGYSVSGAGDVNGDGLDDLIVGAYGANDSLGESYVVFGKADTTSLNLSAIVAGNGGFVINGSVKSGYSVSGAGDVNGDGLDDLIVGAPYGSPGGNPAAGESYVVFGKTDGTAVNRLDLVAGIGGFVINGIDPYDRSGISVSDAGDVNGDGLADLIVGSVPYASPDGNASTGESYVVFGKANGTAVNLSNVVAGNGGFVINGIDPDDRSGRSVSGAGDLNGDGLADVIVGAYFADPGGNLSAGESYVVFGKADTTPVNLSDVVAGSSGFVINGIDPNDRSGRSVSCAGDVNGDGVVDLIVGAPTAFAQGPGDSYVIFGPVAPCPWDCADDDGTVGIVDFLALLAQWDQVGTSCDIDGGGVGIVDFLALLANWGPCP